MKFQKRKLNNGITVIMEKRDLPVVSLSISNLFGGAFEDSKIKGVAHFIEHLLFTGTQTRSHEDISREIEKKGGVLNAYTADEVTSYLFKLPSEHLFSGLDILTDMLNNPKFDPEKFEKEKKVILEEIKMYNDNPRTHAMKNIVGNLYESPFGEWIIGSKETVSSLSRDFVAELFDKMYSPENFIVTIVGDADFEKVCSYLEKNFKRKGGERPKIVKIKKRNSEGVEEKAGIDQAHFYFGMHSPLPNESDFYVLEILNAYLANGMSSRLFLEIREKRGLAYVVRGSIEAERDYSYYLIYVGTTKEAVDEVKEIILDEFEKIKDMSEKDLEEAKERLVGLRKLSAEESSDVMDALLGEELAGGAEDYYKYDEKIGAVKLEDVKRLAKDLVKKYSTAAVVPK